MVKYPGLQVWCPITGSELSVGWGLTVNINKIHGHFSRLSQPITLGARHFSSAVSWLRLTTEDVSAFGQHRKFPPHARKTSGTQGSSLFEEVSKTRKKVSSDVKNQEVDGDLFFNLPLESKDQKANSQDFFHNELIFGQFIREKIDAS